MPGDRTSQAAMADKKASLLAIIEAHARNQHVCPSLGRLAVLLRLGPTTISRLLESLRNDRAISWKLVHHWNGSGKTRVVTIAATGETTALPKHPKAVAITPRGPIFIGPPVRTLGGAEFTKRKAELEARELAAAARK